MKKLLVTGGTGFLGSRICSFYKERFEIIAPGHREMDITEENDVRRFLHETCPDIVIHCAAVSDVGACEKDPERSYRINVIGTENLARISREIGAKCILCSSDQVYFGSTLREPHKEEEVLNPANHYGRQKLYAEQSCLAINPESVHLRLSWMYDRAAFSETEHGDFLRTLLVKLDEKQKISYPVYDVRGITDVWEVIGNLEKVWELPGGVYHFGSPNDASTYDTTVKLFERLGLDLQLVEPNEEAFCDHPRNLSMSQAKINSYGIYFSHTLEGLYRAMNGRKGD